MSAIKILSAFSSPKNIVVLSISIALIIILLVIFCYLQNNLLTVTRISFSSDELPRGFDGFKIVHLSDLHNKYFGKDNSTLAEKINALEPDIVVMTGDFIDERKNDRECTLSLIRQLNAPVYFSPGNHELKVLHSYSQLRDEMTALGVKVLEYEKGYFEKNGEKIAIVGFDAVRNSTHTPMIQELFSEDEFSLLLSHYPEDLKDYASLGADLVFSGHAHGGQWRLPFIGPLFSPGEGLFPKYTSGIHYCENTAMVISRGLGHSRLPLRLFNYPEIVLVTLEAE